MNTLLAFDKENSFSLNIMVGSAKFYSKRRMFVLDLMKPGNVA